MEEGFNPLNPLGYATGCLEPIWALGAVHKWRHTDVVDFLLYSHCATP